MLSEILKLLQSSSEREHEKGWNLLRKECAQLQLTSEDIGQLLRLFEGEFPGEPWRQAVGALIRLLTAPRSSLAIDPEPVIPVQPIEPCEYLADWFWKPFKGPSAVLGLSDPKWRRRDEGAVLMLGRHLSHDNFPNTQFHPIPINDPQWDSVLAQQNPTALCIVGRLGLFGDAALRRWDRNDLRFSFLVKRRPKNPPRPGKIHKRFHCICERVEGHMKPLFLHTTQVESKRTDYALVQRYTVSGASGHTHVITTAGSTGVGTLAATQWAALLLNRMRYRGDRVRLPRDVTDESKLEALLCVTTDPNVQRWALTDIELCKLYVDDWEWSQKTGWTKLPMQSITIECENGDPQRPVAVICRGKRHPLKGAKKLAALVAAIYVQTGGKAGALIDVSELARLKTWGNEQRVRRRLSELRVRHFGEALAIGDVVSITVPLLIQPAAGSLPKDESVVSRRANRPAAASKMAEVPRARRNGKQRSSGNRGVAG